MSVVIKMLVASFAILPLLLCQRNEFEEYVLSLAYLKNDIQQTDIESGQEGLHVIVRYESLVEEHARTFTTLLALL